MSTNGHVEVLGPGLREGRLPEGDLGDLSFLLRRLQHLGLDLDEDMVLPIQGKLVLLERQGWLLDAEATFFLLVLKLLKRYQPWFGLQRYCVLARGDGNQADAPFVRSDPVLVEASVKLELEGRVRHTVREGNGPLHALELALREALRPTYPRLEEVALTGCAVRVLDGGEGTAARVRVVLQSWDSHHNRGWGSTAVADDLVRAGWSALVDALEYKRWLDTQPRVQHSGTGAAAGCVSCCGA
jgi:2-isopropylmalate synthase